jgi:nucleotide-binding universal stress UspA family protein
VPFTMELAKIMGAEVHVVDFRSTERADVKKKLKNYTEQTYQILKKAGLKVEKGSKKSSSVIDAIISYGVAHEVQIISIMSNHRGTPVSLGMSSTSQQLVNHSPIPVLSCHPKK